MLSRKSIVALILPFLVTALFLCPNEIEASTPITLEPVGQFGGHAENIFIDGDIAYMNQGSRLVAIDLSDPAAPVVLGKSEPLQNEIKHIQVVGNLAYLANRTNGLIIIDVSDPTQPVELNRFNTGGDVSDIHIANNIAYIADSSKGLMLVDITAPTSPTLLGTLASPARDVEVINNQIYMLTENGHSPTFAIVNASTPATPTIIGSVPVFGGTSITIDDNTAYVLADFVYSLTTVDITDPTSPTIQDSIPVIAPNAMQIVEDIAYVAGGHPSPGNLTTFDVSDPTNLTQLDRYQIIGELHDIQIMQDVAYLANQTNGLTSLNISNPSSISELNTFSFFTKIDHMQIVNGIGYVLSDSYTSSGLTILDMNNSLSPTRLSTIELDGNSHTFHINNNIAYIANSTGLVMVDVSDLSAPTLLGTVSINGLIWNVQVEDNIAYIGNSNTSGGLEMVDVSNPASPIHLGVYDELGGVQEFYVLEKTVYIAHGNVSIVDVTNPANPSLLGSLNTAEQALDVKVVENTAYIADNGGGLVIVDVSNPTGPVQLSSFNTSGAARSLRVKDNIVYITTLYSGFEIVDVSNANAPILLADFNITGSFQLSTHEILSNSGFVYHTTPNGEAFIFEDLPIFASQHLYVFGFDNTKGSAGNLSPHYQPSIQALIDESVLKSNSMVIALVDLDGPNDTQIVVIQNGQATIIDGLPDATGELNLSLDEYNTANGEQLGWFIKWARDNYLATQTTFTYVGHGAHLVPETDLSTYISTAQSTVDRTNEIAPLPLSAWVNPAWTDVNTGSPDLPYDLISPYDLAQALAYGTDGGANPIDVVDVAHCFGASIEELYELSNADGAPYAETIIASPSYRYFSADLLGEAFASVNASMSSTQTASAMISAYDTVLTEADNSDGDADVQHPRLIIAVESARIPSIKTKWDELSEALLTDFRSPALLNAYDAAAKYDTTTCQADWRLDSPDAVADMRDLAIGFAGEYGPFNRVGQLALDAEILIEQAIITRTVRNGTPWFGGSQAGNWNLRGAGISIFANLVPDTLNDNQYLSWQSGWYTPTINASNPHPYQFVQGNTTWADVLDTYWANNNITSESTFCIPEYPPAQQEGELTAHEILSPLPTLFAYGDPTTIVAKISVDEAEYVINPQVTFVVTDIGTGLPVFTNTVGAGYLPAGGHRISTSTDWIPTSTLDSTDFAITVTIDPSGQFTTDDPSDNTTSKTFIGISGQPITIPTITGTISNHLQWITTTEVALDLSTTNATALRTVGYQYGIGNNPNTYVADWFYFRNSPAPVGTPITLDLAQAYRPLQIGYVMLQQWAIDGSDQSPQHLELEFNYAPANAPIDADEQHFFLYELDSSVPMSITIDASADNMTTHIWSPDNPFSAQVITGTGVIPLDLVDGQHVVLVEGLADGSTYTISSDGDGDVGTRRTLSNDPVRVQRAKPQFVNAIPDATCPEEVRSQCVTSVALRSSGTTAPSTIIVLAVLILLTLPSLWIARRRT